MDFTGVHRAIGLCEIHLLHRQRLALNDVEREQVDHCLDMIFRLRRFSPDRVQKAMRWLGFIQGVLWSHGWVPLNDLKQMNRPLPDAEPVPEVMPEAAIRVVGAEEQALDNTHRWGPSGPLGVSWCEDCDHCSEDPGVACPGPVPGFVSKYAKSTPDSNYMPDNTEVFVLSADTGSCRSGRHCACEAASGRCCHCDDPCLVCPGSSGSAPKL
jgi:hypothetical protein